MVTGYMRIKTSMRTGLNIAMGTQLFKDGLGYTGMALSASQGKGEPYSGQVIWYREPHI